MEEKTPAVTGACMCGAVRFTATGPPLGIGHCHCKSCRHHTGAPVVTYVGFAEHQVVFSGQARSVYNSSPGVARAFCSTCGSSLTWEGVTATSGGKIIEFHVGALDGLDALAPEEHTRYGERIGWFDVADSLPRYLGVGAGNEEPCCYGPAGSKQRP